MKYSGEIPNECTSLPCSSPTKSTTPTITSEIFRSAHGSLPSWIAAAAVASAAVPSPSDAPDCRSMTAISLSLARSARPLMLRLLTMPTFCSKGLLRFVCVLLALAEGDGNNNNDAMTR